MRKEIYINQGERQGDVYKRQVILLAKVIKIKLLNFTLEKEEEKNI